VEAHEAVLADGAEAEAVEEVGRGITGTVGGALNRWIPVRGGAKTGTAWSSAARRVETGAGEARVRVGGSAVEVGTGIGTATGGIEKGRVIGIGTATGNAIGIGSATGIVIERETGGETIETGIIVGTTATEIGDVTSYLVATASSMDRAVLDAQCTLDGILR